MALGIILSLFAAFLFAIGNILEKRAVDGMRAFSLRNLGSSLKQLQHSPRWIFGALASLLGAFVQIFAYHNVSISIVQSLSVAGVIFVISASRIHFHEVLHRSEFIGLVICVVAFVMTMISIYGGGTAPGRRADYATVAIVISSTAVAVGLLLLSQRFELGSKDFVYGASSGLMYGLVGLSNKGLSSSLRHGQVGHEIASVLSTPYLYTMVIAWALAIALFQIGLQRGRMGVLVPLSGSITAIFVIAVGTPVFGETLPHSAVATSLRLTGFTGIIFGSILLTRAHPSTS